MFNETNEQALDIRIRYSIGLFGIRDENLHKEAQRLAMESPEAGVPSFFKGTSLEDDWKFGLEQYFNDPWKRINYGYKEGFGVDRIREDIRVCLECLHQETCKVCEPGYDIYYLHLDGNVEHYAYNVQNSMENTQPTLCEEVLQFIFDTAKAKYSYGLTPLIESEMCDRAL